MTARVAQMWRHPIKSHGREQVDMARLEAGKAFPGDRVWAVAHERSCFDVDRPSWNPSGDFSTCTHGPRLQAITCWTNPQTGKLTLSHPDRQDLTIDANDHGDGCEFIQWVMPISLGTRSLPARLVRAPHEAMTDTGYQSISLINLASHRAIEGQLGFGISPLRWRGNLLVEGLEPWEEMGWLGKSLRIGTAEFEVVETIVRCRATEANPETGQRDVETVKAIFEGFGHRDCGVYLKVSKGGDIAEGADLEVLA